jgi:uncharacterized membrane protein
MKNINLLQEEIKRNATRKSGFSFLAISIVLILIGLIVIKLYGKFDFSGANFHWNSYDLIWDILGKGAYGFIILYFGISSLILAIIFLWQSRSSKDGLDQMLYDKMNKNSKEPLENLEDDDRKDSRRYGVIDRLKLHGEDTGGIPKIRGPLS